jgi:hypothetical protein
MLPGSGVVVIIQEPCYGVANRKYVALIPITLPSYLTLFVCASIANAFAACCKRSHDKTVQRINVISPDGTVF